MTGNLSPYNIVCHENDSFILRGIGIFGAFSKSLSHFIDNLLPEIMSNCSLCSHNREYQNNQPTQPSIFIGTLTQTIRESSKFLANKNWTHPRAHTSYPTTDTIHLILSCPHLRPELHVCSFCLFSIVVSWFFFGLLSNCAIVNRFNHSF